MCSGCFLHIQKMKNKSALFYDAIKNDYLLNDTRSLFQKAEILKISHDFLSVDFYEGNNELVPDLSWSELIIVYPFFADSTNPKGQKNGVVYLKYSIKQGIYDGILAWLFLSISSVSLFPFAYSYLKESLRKEMEIQNLKDLNRVASQVSHDIRSPLSALMMVISSLENVPQEKQLLLKSATQRINDIANDLLKGGKNKSETTFNTPRKNEVALSIESVLGILDPLISEKRIQYQGKRHLEIEVEQKEIFAAFANLNIVEFQRCISNIFDNAVDALEGKSGKISFVVKTLTDADEKKILIEIRDNGKGIPNHLLQKIGQEGFTYGKDGSNSGTGLGLFHAIRTIKSFGGKLSISSEEKKGTTVSIILPEVEVPSWFAAEVNIRNKKYLITLDDDLSIHQLWELRLIEQRITDIVHRKFQNGEEFEEYVLKNISTLKDTVFLIDYELLNQPKTGLQIIEDLAIERFSILMTSHFNDPELRQRAAKLKLRVLPKSSGGLVPIIT